MEILFHKYYFKMLQFTNKQSFTYVNPSVVGFTSPERPLPADKNNNGDIYHEIFEYGASRYVLFTK